MLWSSYEEIITYLIIIWIENEKLAIKSVLNLSSNLKDISSKVTSEAEIEKRITEMEKVSPLRKEIREGILSGK